MPQSLTKAGATTSSFVYGPEHQRTRQSRTDVGGPNNGITTTIYAGPQEVETKVVGSTITTTIKTYWPYGVGLEIDRARTPSNTTSELNWTHGDRLGSMVAYSAIDGSLREKLAYDAWGKRRTLTGAPITGSNGGVISSNGTPTPDTIDGQTDNKGFTGHEMLDALDLVHMNGRIYDPLTAKFLSADPILQDPMNGQSYNRYAYVMNNPTNFTDPTGFSRLESITVVGGRIADFSNTVCQGGGCADWLRSAITQANATAIATQQQVAAQASKVVRGVQQVSAKMSAVVPKIAKKLAKKIGEKALARGAITLGTAVTGIGVPIAVGVGVYSAVDTAVDVVHAGIELGVALSEAMGEQDNAGNATGAASDAVSKPAGAAAGGAAPPPEGGDNNDNNKKKSKDDQVAPEKTSNDIHRRVERDLGKDARRELHDAKQSGSGDRTLGQLKQDARDLYNQAGKDLPNWLK